jgi:hypothetical protein
MDYWDNREENIVRRNEVSRQARVPTLDECPDLCYARPKRPTEIVPDKSG